MKLLVTGACGFIGTNLCKSLLEDGYSVIGVDAFTENYSRNLKMANRDELLKFKEFSFLEADLLKIDLNQLVVNVSVIFHLAGQPSVHNSWGEDFDLYTNRNILLTQKLLCAAKDAKTPRFVYSSSSSIYGRVKTLPTRETDEKVPISPYGVTKYAAENLVTLFGSEFGLSTVSLRYFTVFGPRQRPDMAFNKLISAGLKEQNFSLHGDGSQTRDFTFIDDVVNANKLAAFKNVHPGSIFNIGGGSPVSMNETIEILEDILSLKFKIEFTPLGPGNPMITTADTSRALTTLGWKAKIDIYQGLKAQVDWHLGQA